MPEVRAVSRNNDRIELARSPPSWPGADNANTTSRTRSDTRLNCCRTSCNCPAVDGSRSPFEQCTQPHADREDALLDVIVQARGDTFSLVAEQLFALNVVEP